MLHWANQQNSLAYGVAMMPIELLMVIQPPSLILDRVHIQMLQGNRHGGWWIWALSMLSIASLCSTESYVSGEKIYWYFPFHTTKYKKHQFKVNLCILKRIKHYSQSDLYTSSHTTERVQTTITYVAPLVINTHTVNFLFLSIVVPDRMREFSIRVGDDPDIDTQTKCGFRTDRVPASGSTTITCNPPLQGQYVSMRIEHGDSDRNVFTLCEAVVMGFKSIGECDACLYYMYMRPTLSNFYHCIIGNIWLSHSDDRLEVLSLTAGLM